MMKDQVVETPSQDVAEASATELLNHSFFNDFDMQILQLKSEIEYRIEERKNVRYCLNTRLMHS